MTSGYNGPQLPPIQTATHPHNHRLSFSGYPNGLSNNSTSIGNGNGSHSPSYYYHHPPPPPPLTNQQQQQGPVHSPISPSLGSPYMAQSPNPPNVKRRHTLAGSGGAKPALPYDTPTSPSMASTTSPSATPGSGSSDRRKTPSSWDPNDDMVLRHLKEQLKLGWKEIASHFPNRTTNACQFRWRRLMSGTLRSQNRDATPPTNSNNDALTNSPPLSSTNSSTTNVMTATTTTNTNHTTNTTPHIGSLAQAPQFVAPPSPPPTRYPSYVHTKPPSPPLSVKEEETATKPWSSDEDEMLLRSDLRIEELSVLLPTRTESEIRQRAYELKTTSSARRRTMSFESSARAPQRPLLERPSKFFNGLKLPPPVNQQQPRRPGTFAPALETTL